MRSDHLSLDHADAQALALQASAVTNESDDFQPSSFPKDAIADESPAMQVLEAIGDAMGVIDVLVLEAQPSLDRAALRKHFDGQAMSSHHALTRDGRPWVDGFVSMAGYPQIPIGSTIGCARRHHKQLADLLPSVGQPRVLLLMSPEVMLTQAPMHCLKFMRDLVRARREQVLTVIVCRDGSRIAPVLAREGRLRRDFLVEPDDAITNASAASALEAIERASGKGQFQ